ncbi:MAG: NAD-glutamate dehydrogenase, partial [Alphaproteobacteria bacterium]
QFGQRREIGEPKVRVFNPRVEEHGWKSKHTVIEVVNDDMPFLVDSVTAELNTRGFTVHLVIHPMVEVERRNGGDLARILPAGGDGSNMAVAESFMHFEIDEQSDPEVLDGLRRGIEDVLRDVRAAVEDWPSMLEKVAAIRGELDKNPAKLPPDDITEAGAFLQWIADNQFTFLGYREYDYSGRGATERMTVAPGGLGVLRDPERTVLENWRNNQPLPPELEAFVHQPTPIMVIKANERASVHRPVHMDVIGVKKFNNRGKVTGERLIVGLFTSAAYSRSPLDIPLLRRKLAYVVDRAGFAPASHDSKALAHILETYPRDELLQIDKETLFDNAVGILHLQERQRIALFLRRDAFERYVSALVYIPRDRYNTDLRRRLAGILERAFNGVVTAFTPYLASDSVLAQVLFTVKTQPGELPRYNLEDIEAALVEGARSWADRLRDALVESKGEEPGLRLYHRYADAFSSGYRDSYLPEAAVVDIDKIEATLTADELGMNLYRPIEARNDEVRFKIFYVGAQLPLSDVLPMLENMGLKVIGEEPFEVWLDEDEHSIWIHDFDMMSRSGAPVQLAQVKEKFHDAFNRVFKGDIENDGFNRLVLGAGLDWREVVALRAICKFLRQTRTAFSQAYMEQTLANNPDLARLVVALFRVRFDPARQTDGKDDARAIRERIEAGLDAVESLDEDRILRRFVNVVDATRRTNYFQLGADGVPKPYLSLKLDSREIEELPEPRPMVEIFVYSPRMEGCHLRGGKVARGGIRWSDRLEDFRTEVLGLMKAQMVKNAVIVPVGSKGGFVCKRLPTGGDRAALMKEVKDCYSILMRGMLDLTDNLEQGKIVPPPDVVCHDDDDPYLVVAADKGTATFSDIANGISRDYGFWLGDAFASGGSAGYDHKQMGITARGAWESVKRHFRELGRDIQTQNFTVVGVGDMSGDVFGNGMLLSRHTKMVAAFNHLHIFVDPDPDPAKSLDERKRLFELPRSSWADYDAGLISEGGGVFDRKAKSIKPTPEMKALFGIEADQITPAGLIRAVLAAPVDLLWFGGIGTYVKASHETNAEVGDRANDGLRVDATELECKVIGEGANLAVTQRGRIEFARLGGRVNTDFIDNSAGVDTSDHEVNIKIVIDDIVAAGDLTEKQRNTLLDEMTDDVARLVLNDNYLQSQAITQAELQAHERLDQQWRFVKSLEKEGRLDRAIEFLPDDEEMQERQAQGSGLTRPEYAVLFSYAKLALYDELLPTNVPDDPHLVRDLARYFPERLRERFAEPIARHRLRREIIATYITNSVINRVGATFVHELQARTGMTPADIARAYVVARGAFRLRPLWREIETLDNKVSSETQAEMSLE